MNIFLNQQIRFYSNNAKNLHHLTKPCSPPHNRSYCDHRLLWCHFALCILCTIYSPAVALYLFLLLKLFILQFCIFWKKISTICWKCSYSNKNFWRLTCQFPTWWSHALVQFWPWQLRL